MTSKFDEEEAMLKGFLGNKIGMTQVFDSQGKLVPVTVVSCTHWFVTQIKTHDNDGYDAIQVGKLKKKHQDKTFSPEWLQHKKTYFSYVREIKVEEGSKAEERYKVGQPFGLGDFDVEENQFVNVSGNSIGKGFQGVVKRYNFRGGPSAHGSMFHREPGAISHMRTRGRVIKGKRLPGQMGAKRITVKDLRIVQLNKELGCVFIKGSVPGKKDALLQLQIKR